MTSLSLPFIGLLWVLKEILDQFEWEAGQRINKNKIQLIFSATPDWISIEMHFFCWRCLRFSKPSITLAQICPLGSYHVETWRRVLSRLCTRAAIWIGSTLSPGGGRILIQHVCPCLSFYPRLPGSSFSHPVQCLLTYKFFELSFSLVRKSPGERWILDPNSLV